jgi:hypothetical protein
MYKMLSSSEIYRLLMVLLILGGTIFFTKIIVLKSKPKTLYRQPSQQHFPKDSLRINSFCNIKLHLSPKATIH